MRKIKIKINNKHFRKKSHTRNFFLFCSEMHFFFAFAECAALTTNNEKEMRNKVAILKKKGTGGEEDFLFKKTAAKQKRQKKKTPTLNWTKRGKRVFITSVHKYKIKGTGIAPVATSCSWGRKVALGQPFAEHGGIVGNFPDSRVPRPPFQISFAVYSLGCVRAVISTDDQGPYLTVNKNKKV